jgi:hypothetical protein
MNYFESVPLGTGLRPILDDQEIEYAVQDKIGIYEW